MSIFHLPIYFCTDESRELEALEDLGLPPADPVGVYEACYLQDVFFTRLDAVYSEKIEGITVTNVMVGGEIFKCALTVEKILEIIKTS